MSTYLYVRIPVKSRNISSDEHVYPTVQSRDRQGAGPRPVLFDPEGDPLPDGRGSERSVKHFEIRGVFGVGILSYVDQGSVNE